MAELLFELSLQFEETSSLLIDGGALTLQVDVESLVHETRWCHSEVDESDSGAEIGSELCVLVPGHHEQG